MSFKLTIQGLLNGGSVTDQLVIEKDKEGGVVYLDTGDKQILVGQLDHTSWGGDMLEISKRGLRALRQEGYSPQEVIKGITKASIFTRR